MEPLLTLYFIRQEEKAAKAAKEVNSEPAKTREHHNHDQQELGFR